MRQLLNYMQLETLLKTLPQKCIAVIGDFTLDGYWHADMTYSQLSREAPLYPRPVTAENYSLGGAANVAWNLVDLGVGRVIALTVLGNDWRGDLLQMLVNQNGIDGSRVLNVSNWLTPFYGKIILDAFQNQQEDARIDFVNHQSLSEDAEAQFLDTIRATLSEVDVVVLADYHQVGVFSAHVIKELNQMAREYPDVYFLVDSRQRINAYQSMVLKPNQVESTDLFDDIQANKQITAELEQAAADLYHRIGRPIYITLGSEGYILINANGIHQMDAFPVDGDLDTVGAGDTFLASLAAGLAAGASDEEAGFFAALATTVTIRKIGITGTANAQELLDMHRYQEEEGIFNDKP